MALKLDLYEGFYWVEWIFLEIMMLKMGFGAHWIYTILRCISLQLIMLFSLMDNPVLVFAPLEDLDRGIQSPLIYFLQLHKA